MVTFRTGRLEEKKAKKRILIALGGIIAVGTFLAIFGLNILVGFSIFIDRIRGGSQTNTPDETLILPPTIDPLPLATKSATLKIHGTGQQSTSVIIYMDEDEIKKIPVKEDGTFETTLADLTEGTHTLYAVLTDDKGNLSTPSEETSVTIKKNAPVLEVLQPADNSTHHGDDNRVEVTGKTEDDTSITINSRIVVVKGDFTFSYLFPLNVGDNTLKIVATDTAGNSTTIERSIKYEK